MGPLLLATIVFVLVFVLFPRSDMKSFIIRSQSSVLTISATLGGFLLTVYTIIRAVDNRAVKAMKSVGAYGLLFKHLNHTVCANFRLVAASLLVILIDSTHLSFATFSDPVTKTIGALYLSYID